MGTAVFTGLVETVGLVTRLRREGPGAVLLVERPLAFADVRPGDSVCVSGVCLTVRGDLSASAVAFDVSPETLDRSTLGSLGPGAAVNLERAMPATGRFGGHFVNGHVDATAPVVALSRQGGFTRVRVAIGPSWGRYVVEKGSLALDGVSLTVASVAGDELDVAVIPSTWEATTLAARRPGDLVNVEVDVVAKYVERLLGERSPGGAAARDGRLRALLEGGA